MVLSGDARISFTLLETELFQLHCSISLNSIHPLFTMQPNVTTFSVAAEEKNCGRTTIYRAVRDGRLDTAEVGNRDMILRNEKYEQFEPRNTGRRAARQKSSTDE